MMKQNFFVCAICWVKATGEFKAILNTAADWLTIWLSSLDIIVHRWFIE